MQAEEQVPAGRGAAVQTEHQLLPSVHPEDVAALREELLRRLLRADRPSGVAGRDPTVSGVCRALWGLAMLQVRGQKRGKALC